MMRWLADLVYLIAGLLYLPVALYNALVVGKNRRGWRERFGFIRRFDPQRPRIWVHAVSLGEVNATVKLVEELRRRCPDHDFVVSTTTDTGFARAVQLYGRDAVLRFPLDFSFVIARVLNRVRPSIIVLMELEVWYNLILFAFRRHIPIVVVNGRMTERSQRRFLALGCPSRTMFQRLTWVCAQDEQIASRFQQVGVPNDCVEVTGSLKWDTATVVDTVPGHRQLGAALGFDAAHPVWVCGSTGNDEEAMVLDAYQAIIDRNKKGTEGTSTARQVPPILIIVPRKPERFDEVATLIERRGFRCIRRSRNSDAAKAEPLNQSTVVLGDSMGELRKYYCLANVVFVGRSLVPLGGSDPMEVAALGKPMIVGPHMENFELPVRLLGDADAIRTVQSAGGLASAVEELLSDRMLAATIAKNAREVVLRQQGATARTVDRLYRILETQAQPVPNGDHCRDA